MLESADRLRLTATRLQQDLAGVTVTMNPPRKPENNEGYFEYIEGPVGAATMNNGGTPIPLNPAVNTDNANALDTTVGDFDDILMFTTRGTGQPFVGKFNGGTIQSDVAEVAWFVRGRTLYRRLLVVAPSANLTGVLGANFYANYDVSVQASGTGVVANTLGDLTKRENRFAHQSGAFPYNAAAWRWTCSLPGSYKCNGSSTVTLPTLPTLRECSSTGWAAGNVAPPAAPTVGTLDFWTNAAANRLADDAMMLPLGYTSGTRVADDVILTNVIGFDVKAWDPQAPVFSAATTPITVVRPGDQLYYSVWSATTWATVGQSIRSTASRTPSSRLAHMPTSVTVTRRTVPR